MPFNFTDAGATGISSQPENLFLVVAVFIAIGVIIALIIALYNMLK